MENENDNIARRDELLARFREALVKPMSERYFDIDELLDVFDYAGDVGDDYLRMEALMCMSRFYPEDPDVLERKAIFYSQYSDDAIDKYLTDNDEAEGMIWELLRLRQWDSPLAFAKEIQLDEIVSHYDDFTDEEVVQLIATVSQLGMMDWLKTNLPLLRQKVRYLNMLLYEVAVAAENNQELFLSIQMLEELTELEPFSIYYWTMLARVYASADEGEKAVNAIDYALAINPDDVPSLVLKAKLLFVKDQTDPKLLEVLDRVIELEPNAVEAVKLRSAVYYTNGNAEGARDALAAYLREHPEYATEIIPDLVALRPDDVPGLLDQLYQSNAENSQIVWESWAIQLARAGVLDLATLVVEAYCRNSGSHIYALFPIEDAFVRQDFLRATQLLNDYIENNNASETGYSEFPVLVLIHLMAMIKVGEKGAALEFCRFIEHETSIDRIAGVTPRLTYLGVMQCVRDIQEHLLADVPDSYWADYDPLHLWA